MTRVQLDAGLRRNFSVFLMKVFSHLHPGQPPLTLAWYLKALGHALTEAAATPGGRLAISIPPRHTKSIAAAVALPAWLLGRDPTTRFMVATYSDKLARQHSLACKSVMQSSWYRQLFPHTRVADAGNTINQITTTRGGGRIAVTVGGTVTGLGADIIIVDDCLKPDDARSDTMRVAARDWFDATLSTRLNSPGQGTIISIAQRLHEDDLPAHLIDKGWYLLHVLRARLAFPDLRRAYVAQQHAWRPTAVVVEDASTGASLWDEFKRTNYSPVMWAPTKDKVTRLIGVSARIESGLCVLPAEAPWLDAYRSEFKAFPYGRHDDQVDSTTQFLDYAREKEEWLLEERDEKTGRVLYIKRESRIVRPDQFDSF